VVKVKQFLYRPGHALRFPKGIQDNRHLPVAITSQEIFLVLISVRGLVDVRATVW